MTIVRRIIDFYKSAWRASVASPTGRRLWLILIVKISVLLVLFKALFFPDKLNTEYDTDAERAEAVRSALTE